MALHLSLLLLLFLILILCRVSAGMHVSVQAGGSITIPCHYDLNHINHVKYWCKGFLWHGCSYVVRTDHPKSSSNALISDDINKRIFTMTMTNLKSWDSENYRCVVVINGGPDIRIQWFYLSVTPATPELYVDQQEVTGVEGGSVTVRCYYSNSGDIKWCRMGGDCKPKLRGTWRKSTRVYRIHRHRDRNTHIWSQQERLDLPRRWRNESNVKGRSSRISFCFLRLTSVYRIHRHRDRSIDVKVLLIPWGMLLVVTAGILVTWKMWTKHKDNKAKDQTTNNSVAPFPEDDDDVTYSTVIPQHKAQLKVQAKAAEPDDNVVYNSLALQVTTQQRAAAAQQ
ncbi:uncharacterized protein LOC121558414 [Coregonus clupeaformis]|uniref:uncharacterized protein LOC121558414 n=1 Tax=Coregonus clupeaformis TaxID=59861 RepID=UPI001E1C3109|nr:uncharacterized protein LOC121558414 [Coregonus clupeaformis]